MAGEDKGKEKGSVQYGLEVVGATIPTRTRAPKERPLQDKLDEIKGSEKYWKVWIAIADYAASNVAGGAMRDMKKIYGFSPAQIGWQFTTHRYVVVDDYDKPVMENGKKVRRCKLLVKYDPELIDPIENSRWVRNRELVEGRKAAERLGISKEEIARIDREREANGG